MHRSDDAGPSGGSGLVTGKQRAAWRDLRPAGRRRSDGIWGRHWYESVEASTGFQEYAENNDILPPEQEKLYEACMECYQQLYQHRMKVV